MESTEKLEKMVLAIIRKKMETDAGSKTKSNREAVRAHVLNAVRESMVAGATKKGVDEEALKDLLNEAETMAIGVLDKIVPVSKSKPALPQGAKAVGNKELVESDEVREMAERVIKAESIDISGVSVKYMEVHPKISALVLGKCIKSGQLVKFFGDCDFVIQISGDYWASLSEKAREILVHHELMHICKDYDTKGRMKLSIRDHNVKDFRCIIDKYGIDWVDEVYDGILDTFDEDQREKVKTEKIKW